MSTANKMQETEIVHCRVHKSWPLHYLNPVHTLTYCVKLHLAITLALTPRSPPLNFADPHSACTVHFYFPLLEAVAKKRLVKTLQAREDLASSDL
jgi:hypothetical protein